MSIAERGPTSNRYSNKLVRLLQLLAFQIGAQVSLTELGRNLRKEISKSHRFLFYDNTAI